MSVRAPPAIAEDVDFEQKKTVSRSPVFVAVDGHAFLIFSCKDFVHPTVCDSTSFRIFIHLNISAKHGAAAGES